MTVRSAGSHDLRNAIALEGPDDDWTYHERQLERGNGGTSGAVGRPALPLETSLPGVFTVGDGRSGSIKRVASAVGEGSMAVRVIHEYLALQRGG